MKLIDKIDNKSLKLTHFSSSEKLPLRFYPTNNCNYKCRTLYSTEFCDHQYSKNDPDYKDLLLIFKLFQQANLTEIAKISGREPTLYSHLIDLIKGLNKRAKKITLSTNGYKNHELVYKAIENGVSLVTLPIPSLNQNKYGFFAGLSEEKAKKAFGEVRQLIDNLSDYEVELHFIRILMRGFNDSNEDMKDFITFSKKHNAMMKIFDLNYHPRLNSPVGNQKVEESSETIWKNLYVSTNDWKKKFSANATDIIEFSSNFSCRKVIVMSLKNGVKILMDDFLQDKKKAFSSCRNCKNRNYCREGPFSNGWELRPDLLIQICPLREDLTIDLRNPKNIQSIKLKNGKITVER